MSNVFSCEGRRVLVTGGGSGLGLAMAQRLADSGAKVVLAGRREAVVAEAAESIGHRASAVACDITEGDSAAALVTRAAELAGGPIDILVNNAGVHCKKPVAQTSDADFARVIDTHVQSAFRLMRLALPGMQQAGGGHVLFMASMTSFIGMPRVAAYSAAKSAYLGLVRSLAAELATDGIRVNAIAPGWIESPMLREALAGDTGREQRILDRTPMGRFGEPDDVAWTVVWLCSPAAKFITGTVVPVDGGAHMAF